uniref:RNase H type-1 domain-containing protein n=1 Tax=Oryza brachyantha TaxID=4533 RepID=J3LGX7_ORYBR
MAPPPGILKINFDGAIRERMRDGAWGFVIRDDKGRGVLAGSGRLPMVSDALMVEAEACSATLEAAINHGILRVIIETDCLNLVSALNTMEFHKSTSGVVF